MFRKSRTKIVISIMAALILLLAVTLSSIVVSEYISNNNQNADMLEQYVEIYSLDNRPGEPGQTVIPPDAGENGGTGVPTDSVGMPPDIGDVPDEPLFHLSSFYSVTFSESGDVIATDTGRTGLYSENTLVEMAEDLLEKGKDKGKEGSLIYRIAEKDGYTLVAFIDNTLINDSMMSLIKNVLIIGGVAIVILFIISILISRWIIKPLEENDRKQRQFVSDAGHELKTPVSIISTNTELLSRQIPDNEWLENICYENERMGTLVKRLLELSKAEGAETVMEPVDLSHLVTGEVLPFESIAYENGLSIKSDISDGIYVNGNTSQLSQLVSVLLDNAVKHSEGGNEVLVALKDENRHAVLTVENSGRDITAEQRKHLFDRFYRPDNSRNSESGHYGLGLAIAKAISDNHGGNISVDCRNGQVIFRFSMPIKNI